MSSDTRYYLDSVLLAGSTLISELTDLSPDSGTDHLTGYAASFPHPLFRGVRGQKPGSPFSSPQIGAILAAILAGGNNWCLDLSAGNTDLGFLQGQNRGIRQARAGAVHERLRLSRGWLYWDSISASHQQDATISCRLEALYDETNAPIVQMGAGALTGTPTGVQWYTLGPVKLNGSWLTNEQSWNLGSGIQTEIGGSAGRIYATYAGINQTDPVLSVTNNGKPWSAQALAGAAISADLEFWLRAKDQDGHNISESTASHIKFKATNGLLVPEGMSGQTNQPTSNTLRFGIRSADANSDPLEITVGAKIQ